LSGIYDFTWLLVSVKISLTTAVTQTHHITGISDMLIRFQTALIMWNDMKNCFSEQIQLPNKGLVIGVLT
jgi:hypothetical protein